MSAAEHAADEAGGEVVFSSDGLEPPPVQLRPPPVRKQQQHAAEESAGGGSDAVDTTSAPTAEEAFEAFAGKLYPVTTTTTRFSSSAGNSAGGGGSVLPPMRETPVERLSRLRREMTEVQADLAQEPEENEEILTVIAGMVEELEKTSLPPRNAYQTRIDDSLSAMASSSSSAAPDKHGASLSNAAAMDEAKILARLQKLEASLGSASVNTASGSSVVMRLAELEKTVSRLDEKDLDVWTKKAKVIRQDLEAASKARNKLSTATSGSRSAEDSKTIADLHDQLVQLQGLSTHLPVLSERLQALAHQHVQAATWGSRLQAAEETTARMQTQMTTLENALQEMEVGLKHSAKLMADNVQALDDRMKQVAK